MTIKHLLHFRIFILLVFSSLIGCSGPIGEYFSTRYENTMGYFNTYYNTKKTFDEAIAEIEKSPPKSKDTNYFAKYTINQTARNKLTIVIEKASKIIQFYPRSRWVDDAIIMIGEAYYYQGDYELAMKKFSELIANFPKSPYIWKAHLLTAKSLYYEQQPNDALSYIHKYIQLAVEEDEEDIAVESYLLAGQIYFESVDFTRAEKSFANAIDIKGDKFLRASACYQRARSLENMGDYANANKLYSQVLEYKPDYNLKFRARLNYGKTLSILGKYKEAFNEFEDLYDEQYPPDLQSQVELEIANAYAAMGNFEKALGQYEMVDSLYKRTDAAAKSFYNRGVYYESKMHDYTGAKFYYDKAKSENPSSDITQTASRKAAAFERYFLYHNEIRKNDSLFYLSTRLDSLKKIFVLQPIDTTGISLKDTTTVVEIVTNADTSQIKQDSVGDVTDDTLQDPSERDLEEAPEEELQSKIGRNATQETVTASSRTAAPPTVQLNITPDSALYLVTKNQFELATLFLLDLAQPDSAEFWFSLVAKSLNNNMFIPRALYALAEISRMRNDIAKVDSLYNVLIEHYPDSKYAIQAKLHKGIVVQVEQTKYDTLYEKGMNLFKENKTKSALSTFKQIYKDTASVLAPKALYTSGWIYENVLIKNDSAKLYYKMLVDKYPGTIYAEKVLGKVSVAGDTTTISKFIQIKEIIPPPPPTPKYAETGNNSKKNTDSQKGKRDRDVREENQGDEEIDLDTDEPPDD